MTTSYHATLLTPTDVMHRLESAILTKNAEAVTAILEESQHNAPDLRTLIRPIASRVKHELAVWDDGLTLPQTLIESISGRIYDTLREWYPATRPDRQDFVTLLTALQRTREPSTVIASFSHRTHVTPMVVVPRTTPIPAKDALVLLATAAAFFESYTTDM